MDNKPTYDELERLVSELQRKLKQHEDYDSRIERNRIIGNIAHEFNNLLMGIQGNISLIFLDINPSNAFFKKLKDIEDNIEGGVKLTEKLLDFISDGVYQPEKIKKTIGGEHLSRIKSELNKSLESSPMQNQYTQGIHPGFRVYEQVYSGTRRVLLVDDETMLLDVGKQMLEKTGLDVLTAKSGSRAIDIYEKEHKTIDMVIMDLIMPVMDGVETYYRLKKINPDIKVLFSSGFRKNIDVNRILRDGKGGFIQKPFKMEQLTKEIGRILDME